MTGALLSVAALIGLSGQSSVYSYPIEPVDLPPSIQQGVEMMYIDPEIAPEVRRQAALLESADGDDAAELTGDLLLPANPLFTDLRRALVRYRMDWSALPQVQIPSGPTLKPGSTDPRVALLRERLGLGPSGSYDSALAAAVRRYQEAHGLKADGIAGEGTIASLNLGYDHHARLLAINLDRARTLPASTEKGRYLVVDAGGAQLYLFEDGKIVDRMKVIVGEAATATPMMAALMRFVSVNPYWNVPPDLAQKLIAPRVLAGGLTYLEERGYQVLSDWTDDAVLVDPATVDWAAVAEGRSEVRVRQLPGGGNSMGGIKFMMPNEFGIYLHDTPSKALFNEENRWISNGCIRVEDAKRLATWLFGEMPKGSDPKVEENVDLETPVPVYITYLTAAATGKGVLFRADPYGRDAQLLARYGSEPDSYAPIEPYSNEAADENGRSASTRKSTSWSRSVAPLLVNCIAMSAPWPFMAWPASTFWTPCSVRWLS